MALLLDTHIVPGETPPRALDRYCSEVFPLLFGRKAARKALKRGVLLVNGEPAHHDHKVRPGERIDLFEEESRRPAYPLALRIIYEDSHLAVVLKPAGIPTNGNCFRTAEHALAHTLTPSPEADRLARPRPVHRLDAATGGLLLAARTAGVLSALSRQFERREVEKRYRALAVGHLEGEGVWEFPLDGQNAVTRYRVVASSPSLRNGHLTLLDCWPVTGRTHQIRRHLLGAGHPILGDALYTDSREDVFRGKGLFLWAAEIAFRHPVTGLPLRVSEEEPPKFRSLREREARRWERQYGGDPR